MTRFLLKFCILAVMLLGLPLVGVMLIGTPLGPYLEFPPKTRYIIHASFSWIAFIAYSLFILGLVLPLLVRSLRAVKQSAVQPSHYYPFPWWGWLGVLTGLVAWTLAWTRFSWFNRFQPHTFSPLWLSFILVVNALAYRRKGRCMMRDRPGFFLLLFPTSALFWWFFEYLNRFVQNWYYVGPQFSSWEYFWYATLPFSTVLPAVLGTREWLLTSSWIQKGFGSFLTIRFPYPKLFGYTFLILSAVGLGGIGIWPNYLFPLLWVSPVLIIVSLQSIMDEPHILRDIAQGDWRLVFSSGLAAVICGWFWEMWNYYSLAKWEYSIPFVHRYQIFEMPILGYGGYISFGLECAVIGGMLERLFSSSGYKAATHHAVPKGEF